MATSDARVHDALLRLSSVLADAGQRAEDRLNATVTSRQLRVLDLLSTGGQWSVSGLAEVLGSVPSTVSRAADRLVAAGYAGRERGADDRREVAITLTRRGRQLLQEWNSARRDAVGPLLDGLSEADRAAVAGALAALTPTNAAGGDNPSDWETASPAAITALTSAVSRSSADAVAQTVVDQARSGLGVRAAALQLISTDGRRLLRVAAGGDDETGESESVDRSAAGEAIRTERPVVSGEGAVTWAHHPVVSPGGVEGVLSFRLDDDAASDPAVAAALEEFTAAAALILPAAFAASRQLVDATRTRDWTVAAEMQARQLSQRRLVAHGMHLSARLEPMHDSCSDVYDVEIVSPTVIDVAVLDCRTSDRDYASVTGFAAAAVRQARGTTADVVDQARLADQALWGHFRGRATVDVMLLRFCTEPWAVTVLTTSGFTLLRRRGDHFDEIGFPAADPLGHQENFELQSVTVDVVRGDRLFVLSDGFDQPGSALNGALTRHVERAGRERVRRSPDETTRRIMVDLLDEWGTAGPLDDTTIVCIDV